MAAGVTFHLKAAGDWSRADFDRMLNFAHTLPSGTTMTVTGPAGQEWTFMKLAEEEPPPLPHACTSCGTSDEDCMKRVREEVRACCSLCHRTDTHGALR